MYRKHESVNFYGLFRIIVSFVKYSKKCLGNIKNKSLIHNRKKPSKNNLDGSDDSLGRAKFLININFKLPLKEHEVNLKMVNLIFCQMI